MAMKKTFERIARDLREAKVLGLFLNDSAHAIVVGNIADALEKMNPLFDGEKFATASGVMPVSNYRPISDEEYAEAVQSARESASLKFGSAGSISHGEVRYEVLSNAHLEWDVYLDDREIDGPDCN